MPIRDPAVHQVLGPSSQPSHPPLRPPVRPPHLPSRGPVIVWFRGHDLRIHDHVALDAAVATSRPILALYVLERGAETDGISTVYSRHPSAQQLWGPLSPNGNFALGRVQRWYLHHSLCVLRHQLKTLGITLVLRRVDCAEATAHVVAQVSRAVAASAVFWNERQKPRAYPVDRHVRHQLRLSQILAHGFWSETLIEPGFSGGHTHDDFQSYTTFWIGSMRANPPPRPNPPLRPDQVCALPIAAVQHSLSLHSPSSPTFPQVTAGAHHSSALGLDPLLNVADLQLLDGLNVHGEHQPGDVATIGCAAANQTLATFLNTHRFRRFASGSARRDGMVTGNHLATSRLSPHVRFGEISPRVLFYAVIDAGAEAKLRGDALAVDSARTFLKNMSLREFGYYMLRRYPTAACKPIMPEFEVFPWVDDKDGTLTEAWESGTTGFPIVDAAMRQLLREGWIHNRMRFLVASFFCKYLLLPWPVGAAHLVRTLVDGDEACNSLGWQWTAGCNSDSFPFSTLVNPLSLHHHTRSTSAAASYVRKYVAELADLPNSLIFTPWRATDEERRLYNINIVPLADYQVACSARNLSRSADGCTSQVYPRRIVHGPEARVRARNAMEVMRRIFSAQRQCRTIVVDQTVPRDGSSSTMQVVERGFHPYSVHCKEDEQRRHTGLSVSTVSCARSENDNVDEGMRKRTKDDPSCASQPPPKKQRLAAMDCTVARNEFRPSEDSSVMSVSHLTGTASTISPGEVDLLLSSRSAGGRRPPGKPPRHRRNLSGISLSTSSARNLVREAGGSLDGAPKRPRSSKSLSGSADGRLSVQALLTSAQTCTEDSNLVPTWNEDTPDHSQLSFQRSGAQVVRPPKPSEPKSPSLTLSFGNPLPPSPAFPSPIFSNIPSNHHQSLSRLHSPSGSHGKSTTSPYMPGRPMGFNNNSPPLSLHHPGEGSGSMPTEVMSSRHSEVVWGPPLDHVAGVHDPSVKDQQNSRAVRQSVPSMNGSARPGMFPGVPPMPILPAHFPQQQPHNPQMLVPMRGANMMGVPPLAHPPATIHGQDIPPQLFAVSAMGGHPHSQHSTPIYVYPPVSPYVDMRISGLHGSMQPVMHPMLQHQQGSMSVGFAKPEDYPIGVGPGQGALAAGPANRQDLDAVPRAGPRNAMEREAIARKMAAMNYYDEAYGGKHWEQWQAIALHLLDQYEFSEDTDRETSKAYVRLCVLKDELRDANPEGPRVTVNHCKEVFRILRLPVTGEWDRRGHGGVRGPYCYGCVKRGTVQK